MLDLKRRRIVTAAKKALLKEHAPQTKPIVESIVAKSGDSPKGFS